MGLGGAHDVAQRFHRAQHLAAGKRGAGRVHVVHIAGDLQAGLGAIGDVLADVLQQRAAAHQQQAIAAHQLKREGAEQEAPEEDGHHGDGTASQHDADRHAQAGVKISDQRLDD